MRNPCRRATLTDVANRAGVSIKTASRVINGIPTVSPDLRDRVIEATETLAYRPHRGAATMRSGTSDMVGVIIRDMANSFYSHVAAGAAEGAGLLECLTITCSSEGSANREQRLLEAVFAQRPRGLIITPTAPASPLMKAEMALGCPIVAVDEPLTGAETDSVSLDNYAGSRLAVDAALELGRSRFAILSDSDHLATMAPRIQGAQDALEAHNLRVPTNKVIRNVHTQSDARQATMELLGLEEHPDVIFCANNVAAIGAASEIHSSGHDVAIVAFDAFPLSHTLPQPVFVIEHDDREMGRLAARLLFERIASPDGPIQHLIIPTTLNKY